MNAFDRWVSNTRWAILNCPILRAEYTVWWWLSGHRWWGPGVASRITRAVKGGEHGEHRVA